MLPDLVGLHFSGLDRVLVGQLGQVGNLAVLIGPLYVNSIRRADVLHFLAGIASAEWTFVAVFISAHDYPPIMRNCADLFIIIVL